MSAKKKMTRKESLAKRNVVCSIELKDKYDRYWIAVYSGVPGKAFPKEHDKTEWTEEVLKQYPARHVCGPYATREIAQHVGDAVTTVFGVLQDYLTSMFAEYSAATDRFKVEAERYAKAAKEFDPSEAGRTHAKAFFLESTKLINAIYDEPRYSFRLDKLPEES